jgi:hypothetical protein
LLDRHFPRPLTLLLGTADGFLDGGNDLLIYSAGSVGFEGFGDEVCDSLLGMRFLLSSLRRVAKDGTRGGRAPRILMKLASRWFVE